MRMKKMIYSILTSMIISLFYCVTCNAQESVTTWRNVYDLFLSQNNPQSSVVQRFALYDINQDNIPELLCMTQQDFKAYFKIYSIINNTLFEMYSKTNDNGLVYIAKPDDNEKDVIYLIDKEEIQMRSSTKYFKLKIENYKLKSDFIGEIKSNSLGYEPFSGEIYLHGKKATKFDFDNEISLGSSIILMPNNKYNRRYSLAEINTYLPNYGIYDPCFEINSNYDQIKINYWNGTSAIYPSKDDMTLINVNGNVMRNSMAKTKGTSLYVPIRKICESLNLPISWDNTTKTVIINNLVRIETSQNSNILFDDNMLYVSIDYLSKLLPIDSYRLPLDKNVSILFLYDKSYKSNVLVSSDVFSTARLLDLYLDEINYKADVGMYYIFDAKVIKPGFEHETTILINKINGQIFGQSIFSRTIFMPF